MSKNFTRLLFGRGLDKQKSAATDLKDATEKSINKHFLGRMESLIKVRRDAIGWLVLAGIIFFVGLFQLGSLTDKYKSLQFVDGGIFSEGIVGEYTNGNPLYATSLADASVSKLVFAGLFSYDQNNNLVPDMVETIHVGQDDKTYTVTLKENLFWHDGEKLTAQDVAFTFQAIQNADTNSFLASGWQRIGIKTIDERNVEFKLSTALGSFPHSLTTGIIPKHILKDVSRDQLRTNDFNASQLVGSGPFRLDSVEVSDTTSAGQQSQIGLVAFENYHKKRPSLDRYIIKTYENQENLLRAYKNARITAASDIEEEFFDYNDDRKNSLHRLNLSGQTNVFFKTSSGILSDKAVREALVLGVDKGAVLADVDKDLLPTNSPLLNSHFAYDKRFIQSTNKPDKAKEVLEKAGWKINPQTGIREKGENKTPLRFSLFIADNEDHKKLAESLTTQWLDIGVGAELIVQSADERQSTVATHNYDAIVNSISIGADPDVFAFWHSSQGSASSASRLNYSEYGSKVADGALEAARSRNAPQVRVPKYQPFLKVWSEDNPALTLYQPQYKFLVRAPFSGINTTKVVASTDRYSNVENWQIKRKKIAP